MPKARVAYDVFHPRPWGWKVALYLWTKGIGAGAFALVFLAATLGLATPDRAVRLAAAFVSLAGIGLTTAPPRVGPQAAGALPDDRAPARSGGAGWRSGRSSSSATAACSACGSWAPGSGWTTGAADRPRLADRRPGALAALYTAFLLGQCEARDLWQSPAWLVSLLAHATILGAASLLALASSPAPRRRSSRSGRIALFAGALVNLFMLIVGEALAEHPTTNGRAAAHLLVRGPFRRNFWIGGVIAGGRRARAWSRLVAAGAPRRRARRRRVVVAAAGLLWYELGFIAAGQAVPIS